MALPVELSPHAVLDLEDIAEYIARDDVDAADRWVSRLADRARRLGAFPRAGRTVPEYGDASVREVFVGNYRVIYRLEAHRVLVLKFVEGHKRAIRR